MLEEILSKVGAVKIETVEGMIIAYGQFGMYISIEGKTPEERLLELKPWQYPNFFYVVKAGNDIIGINLDITAHGKYPGNGVNARFKLRKSGWPMRKRTVHYKTYVPTESGLREMNIEFCDGIIDPALIKPVDKKTYHSAR